MAKLKRRRQNFTDPNPRYVSYLNPLQKPLGVRSARRDNWPTPSARLYLLNWRWYVLVTRRK